MTTAIEMARAAGIDPKAFRAALRREGLRWHAKFQPWTVQEGSAEHSQMMNVLRRMSSRR